MNTLKSLSLALLLLPLPVSGAGTNATVTIGWDWEFPVDLGGLSRADYATNIVWQLYSATNVAGPYASAMSFYPTNVVFDGGINFTATVPATNRLAFFKLTAVTAGGESDPSNVLPLLPVMGAGHLNWAKGSR